MVFATGDTHRDFSRFSEENFPEQADLTKEDVMIICGDFGGVWYGGLRDRRVLNRLEKLPFTVAFVSGNHENYDLLAQFPVEEWHGGQVQKLRPHVIHLMRGQMFQLEGKSFFTMGGARSHDISDGILDPDAPDFREQCRRLNSVNGMYRVSHISWWEQELPAPEEYETARATLDRYGWKTDYVVTHCAPTSVQSALGFEPSDALTDFLEEVRQKLEFRYWLFGHYHSSGVLDGKYCLLWEQMIRLP